jgi:putative CocE/NonD family hydrolase
VQTLLEFPRPLRTVEHTWIPLPDGTRLAARLWLPEDAEAHPVPAVLEYIPYRKRDLTRRRDQRMHPYVAGHGYAVARVDVRGTGDSEGVLTGEYTEQELSDAEAVIAWLAEQSWCTGAVGMTGISWGGFNALQVAARRPPALKAILTLCSTDDRYADDAHYMGGCLLNENQIWGSILMMFAAYPPDPALVGERWRDMWTARLDALQCYPAEWLRHPHRDAFWQHGSVCEDYDAITCAVYAVGGWADGYSNAVPRLLKGLSCPRKGLVGPWSHAFPHDSRPGPSIGFLQEALRWWDHWLKDRDTGIMDEPMYRVWMQDSVRPQPDYETRPGRWVAEPAWPSPNVEPHRYVLNTDGLGAEADAETALQIRSPLSTGLKSGVWCAFGADGELPGDQRPDDGNSLVFDSDPLDAPLELLGAPVVTLDLSVDHPTAMLAVRLCEVFPDGTSARLTYGLLNLTHRTGHDAPTPMTPGERTQVQVQLNDCAQVVPAGHRLRVAISTVYWPLAWPSPHPVTTTIYTGASTLTLPVRPPRPEDETLRSFAPPEAAARLDTSALRPARYARVLERDLPARATTLRVLSEGDAYPGAITRIDEIDLDVGYRIEQQFRIVDEAPCDTTTTIEQSGLLRRDDWSVHLALRTELTCTAEAFRVRATLTAHDDETEVGTRTWDETVPRLNV